MSRLNGLYLLFIVMLIVHESGNVDAARILGLFPIPLKSHFVMCETLMRGLAARGHHVDVVSSFPLKNPPANYRDVSLADVLPPIVNDLTLEVAQHYTGRGIRSILAAAGIDTCGALDSPQIRNLIEQPPKDPSYDLIINEQMMVDCYMAFSRQFKVPIVGIVTSKLYDWMALTMGNPESPAFVPSIFSDFTQHMSFVERLQNTILSNFIKINYWLYNAPQQLNEIEKHFGLKIPTTRELWKDVAILLINTHPSFDLVRPIVPGIVEVGGLHVNDGDQDFAPEVKKWLDDSTNGCVYISFGSMLRIETFPKEFVQALYGAFERIAPVRVLMKVPKKDELPTGVPKNVMTRPWLPQTRVLRHKNVKLFVTHCGLMSTQEAIMHGVPMIGVPVFSDQYLNAQLCKRKNVMIALDYRMITVESFTEALNGVLKNASYIKHSKHLAKLFTDRPMRPLDTAIFWVEYVIRNGNVLRPPADYLAWWQIELLDVYAFIIALLLLALFVIKKVIGMFIRQLLSMTAARKGPSQSHTALRSKKDK